VTDPTANPYTLAADKTAQTEPLTEGQKIVAKWEADMIAEPCELADMIDTALIEAWDRGREGGVTDHDQTTVLVVETGDDWTERKCPRCGRIEVRAPGMPVGLFCMPCSGYGPPVEDG
jgi:hypothetical protein